MTRPTNLDRAQTSKFLSETVENYVDMLEKGIEPATIVFISGWVFFAIEEDYPSREAFLLRIEAVVVPVILLMTVIASSGGLAESLVKSLLVSQLMTLMAMVQLEEFTNEAGDQRFRLGMLDRLFIVSWIPLIYFLLTRTTKLSASMSIV
jgi:hypothetical protein